MTDLVAELRFTVHDSPYALVGEIERLTAERDDYCRQLTQGIRAMRDVCLERDRLRAALELYSKNCGNCGGAGFTYWYPTPELIATKKPCQNAACVALAGGAGKGGDAGA